MKFSLLLLASTFLSLPNYAAAGAPKACGNFVTCGRFVGKATEFRSNGTTKKFTQVLELKEIDDATVELHLANTSRANGKSRTWAYRMKFATDGQFQMLETAAGHEGEVAAVGGCQQMRCNYRFQPSEVMTTGNFAFNGNSASLTVHQLLDDGAYFVRGATLTKK